MISSPRPDDSRPLARLRRTFDDERIWSCFCTNIPRFPMSKSLPDSTFTRRGADLTREIKVTLREALLGGEIPVRTLKGRVLLTIPAGTQNGKTFRLSGQGMPRLKGHGSRRPIRDPRSAIRDPQEGTRGPRSRDGRFSDLSNSRELSPPRPARARDPSRYGAPGPAVAAPALAAQRTPRSRASRSRRRRRS